MVRPDIKVAHRALHLTLALSYAVSSAPAEQVCITTGSEGLTMRVGREWRGLNKSGSGGIRKSRTTTSRDEKNDRSAIEADEVVQ